MSSTRRSVAAHAALPFVLLALVVMLMPRVDAEVRWRSGPAAASNPMPAAEIGRTLTGLSVRGETRRVVLHFDRAMDAGARGQLEAAGVRLLGYLGDRSWFASLTERLDVKRATAVPGWVAVEAISPVRKLHPDLAAGIVRPWSVVAPDKMNPEPKPGEPAPDPVVAVYVLFHPDVPLDTAAAKVVSAAGGIVESVFAGAHGVVAHLPASRVGDLAAADPVMYVEPPLPPLDVINDSNRPRVGADVAQGPSYGLDGSGVTVLVYDGGQVFAHGDFAGRLTIGASDTSSISDHATHVAGTIGGDGAGSGGQYTGMAPAVDIVSYGFEQEGGLQQGFLYTDPGDIEADYGEAISTYGADVSNNSIGTNTAPNGYPCDWEGNYGATGVLIDSIVGGYLGEPFRIVWANGNERGSGRCGTTYLTTAPPACAKNHITVGALNSNDDSVTDFTSWGPCDDGRLKPDISAPGCQSNDDNGVTSTNSSGGYNTKCGTSMASPTTAGVVALMLQQYRQTLPGAPDPRNATVKAILANTATDIENPGPDYMSGYGSIRVPPALDLIAEERFLEDTVAQGQVYTFIVLVNPGDPELKVTLAWDDAPGTPNVDPVLVNDLDLRVIGPDATTYWPWTLDPANPANPAVQTTRDGVNNIEQVAIPNPAPGAYRVEVEGFNIASGGDQPFGVAASPTLINCAPAGILAASAGRIACDADLGLDVIDCDLNTDDATIQTVSIQVTSTSEPSGETVLLTETAPETADFAGTLPVSTTDAAGVLQVAEGDLVTATYIDADDGNGNTNVPVVRTVVVDCTPPVVLGTQVLAVGPRSATIEVTADEPVSLVLRYGTTCGAPTDFISTFGLNATHQVNLRNLQDDTAYFYTIEVADEAGNPTFDDNNGACYGFTTPEIPDFFTEQFSTGLDLQNMSITFTPNGSIDFYSACIEPLGGFLPTDPAPGEDLGLGDDQPTSRTLTGHTVQLYGTAYDTVYIGPNGYVTFDSGDSSYSETFSSHFSHSRVAAVFDDINPSSGGQVTWRELSDRAVISWVGVPEYSTSNSNTFQIELFYDGRIRISWLDIAIADAISGLSQGGGVDPDFFASDLSAVGSCGPRPPVAQSLQFLTGPGVPIPMTLAASDDGLPAPPAIGYRIVSLPLLGTVTDDGTGLTVTSVPWNLSGPSVTYTPAAGYEGSDQFGYNADDGGTPPDGGVSNTAIVSITVGSPSAAYEFLVDDTDPGWSTTGEWAFGQPTGGGSHNLDPSGGFTGNNVYGYNLSGDYPSNMAREYLTSGAMDLSGVTGTTLEFQRWLGIESATYDHATVELSTDGGSNWMTVWDHSGGAVSESAWSLQTYDLSAMADGQPSVQLRWVMGTTDGSVVYPGWNIDDIRITGNLPVVCNGDPGEVANVGFGADGQMLYWTPPPIGGGDPPAYDTLRSAVPGDFGLAALCIEIDDASDTQAMTPDVPSAGQVHYFLVRAENNCGVGSVGQQSDGTPRAVRNCVSP